MLSEETKQLCQLFATVLDYPGDSLRETTAECLRRLEHFVPSSAAQMRSFVNFTQGQRREALEELYTHTFDVSPATTPYLGYHLFGEGPKRSVLMVKLQEAYQAHQFSSGTELADHLCVLLRFLSIAEDAEFALPLLQECILPALEKIEKAFSGDHNGYSAAVSSLRMFLRQVHRELTKAGGMVNG